MARLSKQIENKATWAILSALLVAAAWRAFSFALYPDETSFFWLSREWATRGDSLIPPNQLGYGSLWWVVLSLIDWFWRPELLTVPVPEAPPPNISPPMAAGWNPDIFAAIWSARLVSVGVLFAAIAYVLGHAFDPKSRLAVLSFLSLPVVWWNGRLASPDLFTVAICLVLATEMFRGRWRRVLFWFGVAAGLKLSNAVVLCGFAALGARAVYRDDGARGLAKGVGLPLLGYAVANPYALVHPAHSFELARGVAPHHAFAWEGALRLGVDMLSGNRLEWDVVSVGSFLFWFGSPLIIAFVAFVLLRTGQGALLAAGAVGLIVGLAAIVFRNLGYGWYFMPLIAVMLVCAALRFGRIHGAPAWLAGALLAVGCGMSASASWGELQINFDRDQSARSALRQGNCIASAMTAVRPGALVHILTDPVVLPPGLTPDDTHLILLASLLKSFNGRGYEPDRDVLIVSSAMIRYSTFVRTNVEKGIAVGRSRTCGKLTLILPTVAEA